MAIKIRAILSLAACALVAAMACPALAQNSDKAKNDDPARLKQLHERVAAIEAAIKRIEQSNSKDGAEALPAPKESHAPAGEQRDSPAADDDAKLDSMEKYIVTYTNAYRQKRGLPALKLDTNLSKASKSHSEEMNRLNFFSHDSPVPGKTRFTDRASERGTTASAENIASGAEDGKAALGLWLNSQHHRENIEGDYRRIGVGHSEGYYTQLFGN